MKTHASRALPALLALVPLLLPAASPAAPLARHFWEARPADPRPAALRVPHGSAALLEARLPEPPAAASFHWQTNGMDGLWWEAPAECRSNAVAVVWTPAMDTGADDVRAFFRVEQEEGPDYSAFANIRLLPSPGFAPSALPLPARAIDFAEVQVSNAPWLEAEADPTVPAWAKAATPPLTEEADPVWAAEKGSYATAAALSAAATASTNYTAAAFARADEAQESAVVAGDEERQRADLLPLSADIVTCVRPTHDLTITYRVCVTGAVNSLVTPALLYRPGPEVVPPSVLPASFGSYTNSAPFSGSASATVDWTAAAPVVANTNAAAARPEIAEGLRGRFWIISSLPAPMTLDLGDGGEPLSLPAGTARREVSGRTGTTTVTLTGEADSVSLHICPVAVQELFWSWDLSDSLSDGWHAPFWMRWARPSSPAEYLFCARTVHLDATTNWTRSVTIAPNGERIEAYHAQPLPSDGTTELQPLGLYRFGHWGAGVGWAPGDGDELGGSIRDRRVWYRALGDAEIEALYIASGGSATNATAAADLIALARAADARRDAVAEARQYTDDMAEAAADYADASVAAAMNAIPAPDLSALVPTNRTIAGVALDADIPLAGRIEVTNNLLRVFAPTNSASDPVLAWEQPGAAAILPALSAMSNLVAALSARVAALEAGGGAAQWANFDAQGNPNPDPDSTLLNRPFAAIAGGFQWVSSGGCYALAASGAVAFAADTGGEVRLFGSSVSNSVGLHVGGDVVTVGCNATGFVVTGSGASAVASITYPYSGGAYPVIYGATSPVGPWTEMAAATWVADTAAGTATASFPATATGYFFRATTDAERGDYWHARVPSLLEGGVMVGASDVSPVVYDTTITITNGGNTYRLPAQTVP